MKRVIMAFTMFLALHFQLSGQGIYLSEQSRQIPKQFLSFDPLNKRVDSLIINIAQEGVFVFDTIIPKDEKNLFYSRAYSQSFNPFTLKGRTELQIRESRLIRHTLTDTGIVFQLILIPDSLSNDIELLKKEFKLLRKKLGEHLKEFSYQKSKKKASLKFETCSFLGIPSYGIISIGWGPYYQRGELNTLSFSLMSRTKKLGAPDKLLIK